MAILAFTSYFIVMYLLMIIMIIFSLVQLRMMRRRKKVFLVNFSCYKPGVTESITKAETIQGVKRSGFHTDETLEFMRTAMEKAGLGDSTYVPENMLRDPADLSLPACRKETERVMFGAIDELLGKTTGVRVQDIGILVVNCSLFQVVPSLACIIVNRYKLRETIASYSLTGMGCSCGLVAIDLASRLLQIHRHTYALVVSTENISGEYYKGNDRSKIVTNALFRLGGAAVLLSNKPSEGKTSKYQFLHAVRTNTSSLDTSYNCIFQEEDEEGAVGVTLNKDLLVSAATTISLNLTSLGPLILPLSEKLLLLKNLLIRTILRAKGVETEPYVPNFSRGVGHFFPHVGGKPVLDDLQKKLGFSDVAMEASRMTLYRFGNTSSSSVWYALAYAEAKGRVKKGDLLWQMAFGSGFKCSSVVWRATRLIEFEAANPWSEEIHNFPHNLDHIQPLTAQEFYLEPSK